MKERIHYWDNLKGVLILLVVLGHLLEKLPDGRYSALYKMIYLFHMPLFVFCSGFLARFRPKKIVSKLLIPYAVLQVVGCIGNGQPVQLHTPVWILWYLPALAMWQFTLPLLDRCPRRFRPLLLISTVAAGCAAGFCDSIGYFLSLSRAVVFLPYFAAGYFIRQHQSLHWFASSAKASLPLRVLSGAVIAALLCIFLSGAASIRPEWLYGAASYHTVGSTVLFRAAHYLLAAVCGLIVLLWVPRRPCPLTHPGRCSLLIYLSHIVLVPVAEALPRLVSSAAPQYLLCGIIAAVYCAGISILYQHLPAEFRI